MSALVEPSGTTLILSGSFGVLTWVDNGITGIAPAGTVLVLPLSGQAFRGLVVLP